MIIEQLREEVYNYLIGHFEDDIADELTDSLMDIFVEWVKAEIINKDKKGRRHTGGVSCPLIIKSGIAYSNAGYGDPKKNWMKKVCCDCKEPVCFYDLTNEDKKKFKRG